MVNQAIDPNNLEQAAGSRDGKKQNNLRYILKTECGEIF